MFIVLSKFVVANSMTEEVKTAFKNRPHLVENTLEFIRLDVITPIVMKFGCSLIGEMKTAINCGIVVLNIMNHTKTFQKV